jgi:Ni/Co efflux regulator RcnB
MAYKSALDQWKKYLLTNQPTSYHWYQFADDGSYLI